MARVITRRSILSGLAGASASLIPGVGSAAPRKPKPTPTPSPTSSDTYVDDYLDEY